MSCRTIHCPLHGTITLTPTMCAIIDTPEFQRLHHIRQLGASYLVYPGATHTRFEHSIGVSHLAGVMIKSLQTHQPNLEISERTIELVRIAGLVHDLGHGPYSHLFEHVEQQNHMRHEERSIHMLTTMVQKYQIPIRLEEVHIIKGMIDPDDHQKNHYLCQIVANKVCSIDVDKIDYILRDSYHVGFGTVDRYDRLLTMCRVQKYYGNLQLAWPFKLQDEIISLFQARYRLHRNVYNHRTVKASEIIIAKLLQHFNRSDFVSMMDHIIFQDTDNADVQTLQRRLLERNLPKSIMLSHERDDIAEAIRLLDEKKIQHFGLSTVTIGFTSSTGKNPLYTVRYFKPGDHTATATITTEYTNFMAPKTPIETFHCLFTDEREKALPIIRHLIFHDS